MNLPLPLMRSVARALLAMAAVTLVVAPSSADAGPEQPTRTKDKGGAKEHKVDKGAKDKGVLVQKAGDGTEVQGSGSAPAEPSAPRDEEAEEAAPAPDAPPNGAVAAAPREAEDGSASVRAADDDVQSVGSSADLEVAARSLKLTKTARTRLAGIAARYRAATGKRLVITGGDRDARQQAKLMYKKAEAGEDLLALYVRTELVRPILAAYKAEKSAKRHSERSVIAAMTKVIEAQRQRDEFVSRHLEFGAADVRSRGLRDSDVSALKAAVRAESGAQLVDERDSSSPHLHLGL